MSTLLDIREHFRIAWPLAAANLLQSLSSVVIFGFLATFGSRQVAAAALAIATYTPCAIFLSGLASAMIPLFASVVGSTNEDRWERRRLVLTAICVGLLVSLALLALLSQADWLFTWSGQDIAVGAMAASYLHVLMWGLPFIVCINVYRIVMAVDGSGRAIILSAAMVLFSSALLAWLTTRMPLFHGLRGMNLLACVNVTANCLGFFVLFLSSRRALAAPQQVSPAGTRITIMARELLRLGIPAALTQALQVSIFNLWFFLIGSFDHAALAAFAISTQLTTLAFVAMSGSGQALSIQVASATASRNATGLWHSIHAAFVLATTLMLAYSCVLLSLRGVLGSLLFAQAATEEPAPKLLTMILPFTLTLLALDVVQVLCVGILRGLRSTLAPLKIALVGNVGIGVPIALFLASVFKAGVSGILIGAIVGSLIAMFMLIWASNKTIARNSCFSTAMESA